MNLEVLSTLPPYVFRKDKQLELLQSNLGIGLSALGVGISSVLHTQELEKSHKESFLQPLTDAGKILCNVFNYCSSIRKTAIMPHVDNLSKPLKDPAVSAPIDEYLFGSGLSERIKAAQALEQTGKILSSSQVVPTSWRKPPRTTSSNVRTYAKTYSSVSKGSTAAPSKSRPPLNSRPPASTRRNARQTGGTSRFSSRLARK